MSQPCLTLRPGTLADIGAVMAIERSPDYSGTSLDRMRKSIARCSASASHAYRLGVGESGAVEAFAIVRGLGDPHLNLYLKRIAVTRPGRGLGTAFLRLVLDEAFGPLGAERFHLDCFADNVRAQRSYEKRIHSRRRDAEGVSTRRRNADRPRHDGDPEERMGRAAALAAARPC